MSIQYPVQRSQARMTGWMAALGAAVCVALMLGSGGAGAVASFTAPTKLLHTCSVGGFPSAPTYDPVTHDVYVLNQLSNNISVLRNPCTVAATIKLPSTADPISSAFDPQDNYVYVADETLNQVYVLHGNSLIKTLTSSTFNAPSAVAFDPGDGIMLVANFGSDILTSIDGTTVGGTIPVGIEPNAIGYDPYYNTILVATDGGNNVTVLDNASYPFTAIHTSVNVGGSPVGIVFDPADDYDYVANFGSSTVTVLTGTGTVVATLSVNVNPLGITFSQATLHVYVGSTADHTVQVIGGTSGTSKLGKVTLPKGSYTFGLAYDEFNDDVYVTGAHSDQVYVIS
jgi:DNA-binding beta-propeller fold protein YncE